MFDSLQTNISKTGPRVAEYMIPLLTLLKVFFHAIFDISLFLMQGPPGEIGLPGPMGQIGEQVKCLC